MSDIEFLKAIGRKIRTIRKEQKLSVPMLAKRCELHKASCYEIEWGKKSARILTLKKIAQVLNVDVKDFL